MFCEVAELEARGVATPREGQVGSQPRGSAVAVGCGVSLPNQQQNKEGKNFLPT